MKILLKLYALALIALAAHAVLGMEQEGPNTQLWDAISNNDVAAAKQAIEQGADVNNINQFGNTPVGNAMADEKINRQLLKILIEAGANLNLGLNLPIFAAIMFNRADLVKFLIEAGADVNIASPNYGYTPLYAAATQNRAEEIADLLIDAGANIAAAIEIAQDKKDNKVIKYFDSYQNTQNTNLLLAANANNLAGVQQVLARGANVNFMYVGYTPLYFAAEKNNDEMAKLLIEAGASITIPLNLAKQENRDAVIKFLTKYLLEKYQGEQGYTAPAV